MSGTDPKTVRMVLEDWAVARRALQLAETDDVARSATRQIYKAVPEICAAYLRQFADSSGRPRLQPQGDALGWSPRIWRH
jgi:hypothetical protein